MNHEFAANDRVALAIGDDGVARVTLTRGDKLNALDPAMFEALLAVGQALFELPGLRCVVLSGKARASAPGSTSRPSRPFSAARPWRWRSAPTATPTASSRPPCNGASCRYQ